MKIKSKGTRIMGGGISALLIAIAVMVGLMLGNTSSLAASAETAMQSVDLSSQAYEFTDNSGYGFGSTSKVKSYSNGATALGTLSVKGEKLTVSTYGGVQAIGLDSGTALTFSYKQTVNTKNYNGYDRKLSSDSATSICGYNTGTIGSGGIIVLKSKSAGGPWTDTGAKMVGINGKTFTFIPSGDDLATGTYYRFLSVAEIYYTTSNTYRTWYTLWIGTKTEYTDHFTNLGQESIVYVCSNSAAISFTSKETQNYEINKEDLTKEQLSLVKKGVTLSDGAASFSPIIIDGLGNSCYKIVYSHNGGSYSSVSGKTTLTKLGRYTIKVTTPLGKEKVTTLFIMDKGDDLGASSYFREGIIDGTKRIYDVTKGVPVYMLGKKYKIDPVSNVPGLWGSLYYYKDDAALKANNYVEVKTFKGQTQRFDGTFDKQGYYIFNLYSNDPVISSGEIVNYSYRLYVKNQPNYVPSVNKGLITATSRNSLFKRKIYATVLKTASGGSFVYAFPHTEAYYEEALALAEQIELLSVEEYSSYYYYKSLDPNVNTKQKYTSKVKLFEAIGVYAEKNVCTLYLENNTDYLTRAADEEHLKDLTKLTIRNDTLVVVSDEVKKALQSDETYLNGFSFAQIADYESESVTLSDENNKRITIPYNKRVDNFLFTTQKYKITERCWNGSVTYDAIYYNKNDNKAEITMTVSGLTNKITFENEIGVLTGSNIKISSAEDKYDSQSILMITDTNGKTTTMLLSEAKNYSFPNKDMDYTISVAPRLGTEKTFKLSIKYKEEQQSAQLSTSGNSIESDNYFSENKFQESDIFNDTKGCQSSNLGTSAQDAADFANNVDNSSNSSTKDISDEPVGGLSSGATAGIVIGCIFGLVIITTVIMVLIRRKFY